MAPDHPGAEVPPREAPRRFPRTFAELGGIFYGWKMVAVVSFLIAVMSLGVFQGVGTYLVALERQFGWSRTALSGAFAFSRVQGAAIGPVEGFLIDRFGCRRMIIIGFSIMGAGFIFLSRTEELWQFYLGFIILTLGSGLGGWLACVTIVNNWFIRRRSIAMSSAMSGIHIAGLLVSVLALAVDKFGFHNATLGIGVFVLLVCLPMTKFIRNRPEEYGLQPDGNIAPSLTGGPEAYAREPDFTAREALRTRAFWIIAFVHLSSSVAIVSLALHLVPKLTDMGMSLSSAGIVVLTYTAIALPSQTVAGYVADRMPKTAAIFVFIAFQAAGIMVIALADSVPMVYLFAVLYGIGFGGRVPLLTAIRGDYFGRKSFATIMGLSQLPNNIGMIVAPLFAGYMFDTTGSYLIPFSVFAGLTALGGVVIWFASPPKVPMSSVRS
ncbi:MAG: MFS transporter [Dehalococcoidia bacterium]|nr:MFS transporter [Dehalococcoidia bacterium]